MGERGQSGLLVAHGAMQEGWRSAALGLTLYSDHEIFGWSKTHRVIRTRRATARETFLSDFAPGEYVVHLDHGIGRYRGLVTLGQPTAPAPLPARDGGAPAAAKPVPRAQIEAGLAKPAPAPPFLKEKGGRVG